MRSHRGQAGLGTLGDPIPRLSHWQALRLPEEEALVVGSLAVGSLVVGYLPWEGVLELVQFLVLEEGM